jgi:hypothetical protein
MYSEPVETSAEMIMHLKNSLGLSDTPLWIEQVSTGDQAGETADIPLHEITRSVQCADFGYSNEKFLDGINSNSPIEVYLYTQDAYVAGAVTSHFFTELNYNLSIRQGQVTYIEPKGGVGFVY